MKTCKDCIYYDDSYDGEFGDAICRFNPPNGYNITKKDEWCGQWINIKGELWSPEGWHEENN